MKTNPSHPLRLLRGVVAAAVLAVALLAQAAETATAKPALLATPKAAADGVVREVEKAPPGKTR